MSIPSPRLVNLVVFLGCVGLMATALFFEHVMGLEPCYLCIMQRVMVIATGSVALIATLHNPATTGIKVYGLLSALTATGGGMVSIRQLWLQSLPADQVPACGPSLDYMLDVFPIFEVIEMLLQGDGSCAEVLWSLFGISMPGWVLVAFIGLTGISLFQIFRRT